MYNGTSNAPKVNTIHWNTCNGASGEHHWCQKRAACTNLPVWWHATGKSYLKSKCHQLRSNLLTCFTQEIIQFSINDTIWHWSSYRHKAKYHSLLLIPDLMPAVWHSTRTATRTPPSNEVQQQTGPINPIQQDSNLNSKKKTKTTTRKGNKGPTTAPSDATQELVSFIHP